MAGGGRRARSSAVHALKRDSHVAMYRQIAQLLRAALAEGVYAAGERIPTEPEIAERFSVSRITARQAVEHLAREGLVIRKQGKGTFVAGPLVRHDLLDLRGIYDELVDQGLNPTTELLEYRLVMPPPRIADRLRSGSRKVLHWRRLYRLKGKPFAISAVHLHALDVTLERETVARLHTYAILESVLGLKVESADVAIRYERGKAALCRQLELSPATPLMTLERVSYSKGGVPREHTLYYAAADSYEFSIKVRGPLRLGSRVKQAY